MTTDEWCDHLQDNWTLVRLLAIENFVEMICKMNPDDVCARIRRGAEEHKNDTGVLDPMAEFEEEVMDCAAYESFALRHGK